MRNKITQKINKLTILLKQSGALLIFSEIFSLSRVILGSAFLSIDSLRWFVVICWQEWDLNWNMRNGMRDQIGTLILLLWPDANVWSYQTPAKLAVDAFTNTTPNPNVYEHDHIGGRIWKRIWNGKLSNATPGINPRT